MALTDYVVRLRGQDELTGIIKNLGNQIKDTGASAARLDEIQKEFKRIAESTAPAKRQLRDIQKLLSDMNLEGLDRSPVFTDMAQYAGELADAIGDARQAVNAFANDQFRLESISQAFGAISAGATLVTSSMELMGIKNEEATQAIKKLQAAMVLLNSVQQISTLLNKDSALMLRLRQLRAIGAAAATSTDAAAIGANSAALGANTVAATIANRARQKLNATIAVAKALMGDWTGLVLIGAAALGTYALAASDANDKLEDQEKTLKKNTSALQTYNSKVGSEIGVVISKFKSLQAQYLNLRTELEKVKFINDNKEAFKQLGLSIRDVTDAQKAFVQNSDKVVAALVQQAKARAMSASIEEKWKDYYNDSRNTHHFSEGIKSRASLQNEADKKALDDYMKIYGTEKQKKQYKKDGLIPDYMQYGSMVYLNRRRDEDKAKQSSSLEKETQALAKGMMSLENSASSTLKSLDLYASSVSEVSDSSSPKSGHVKEKPEKTQLELDREGLQSMQKEVKDAVNDFNNGLIDKETLKATVDKANAYFKANGIKTNVGIKFYIEDGFEKVKQGVIHDMPTISLNTDVTSQLENLPKSIEPLKEIETDSISATEAVGNLGSAFAQLGSAIGGAGGQMIAFAGQTVQAIAQLIPEIMKMIGVKEGEAMAGAAASGAGIGFPQNLAAIAAGVAAVASIFASIPKFASGGIVPGGTAFGDNMLVRANPGELILNPRQQGALFDAIDSGELGGGRNINVTGEFRIKNGDLVAVINNHNSKMKKQS